MQSTISNMASEIKGLKKLTANWRSTLSALRKKRGLHIGKNIFLTLKRNNAVLKLS